MRMYATLVVKGPPSSAVGIAGRRGLLTTVENTIMDGALIRETVLRTALGTNVMLREIAILAQWLDEPVHGAGTLMVYSLHDEVVVS
jgi:hypothetical protein